MNEIRIDSEMPQTTPERKHLMGDKKGKKDKAKASRQKNVKQARNAQQKKDKQTRHEP